MVRSFLSTAETEAGRKQKLALALLLWLRRSWRRYLGFVAFAAALLLLISAFYLSFFNFYGPISEFLRIRVFFFIRQVKSGVPPPPPFYEEKKFGINLVCFSIFGNLCQIFYRPQKLKQKPWSQPINMKIVWIFSHIFM
jgi:hypothetical protein